MSTFLHTAETTSGRVSRKTTVRVARDEAVDVLHEMHRLAEERLVEACASFQDIAFEMEWRLVEWNRLQREQKQVEKLLSQKRRTSLQFNNRSHPRGSEVRNRTAAWQRQVATLVRRQRQHKDKMTRLADTIRARNTEGVELFNEIELLQARALRIEQALKHMKRQSANRNDEAFARLAVELSLVPDIADPDVLVAAANMVQTRLGN